ncbi:SDR family oxidoreductase [Spirosoma pomorum]
MTHQLLITGATGDLGRRVINHLTGKAALETMTVLVRDGKNELAKQYQQEGIAVRIGDYADVGSLINAFTGVDVLYFVSAGDDDQRAQLHKNVIAAAKQAGVNHIVYTSAVWKDQTKSSPLATLVDAHKQTENTLKASGLTYTILKHNLYAEVIQMLIGDRSQLMKTKTIYLPTANGLASFVAKDDLAEAEATILLNHQQYENKTLAFNGSEALTFSAIAQQVGMILNEPITYISPDVATFENQLSRLGLPHPVIEILKTFSVAIAQGEFDQQSTDLATILGRPTRPLADFLTEAYR